MATHSSILAWRILWTEEPDGLQSIGSQESEKTEAAYHACMRVYVEEAGICEHSVPYPQICCKLKTSLKNESLF